MLHCLSALRQLVRKRVITPLAESPGVIPGLRDCHVEGLTSVVLAKYPDGKLIRIFATEDNHKMHFNTPKNILSSDGHISLALHPHHCDLRLIRAFGKAVNVNCDVHVDPFGCLHKFEYTSAIRNNQKTSVLVHETDVLFTPIVTGATELTSKGIFLPAKQLHTVCVPKKAHAAWFVIEGARDPTYENVCYTNHLADMISYRYMRVMTPQQISDFCKWVLHQMK